ncbi:class I SAM-dependent methyltransferase [Celeribacter sp. PS-C1]|uniref:class I SAM-dependent methyltransferase n=1 Tax=Celeribacter sp. PS-C1 TaxID=2820813 RepID=UPI001C666C38|nr:class I SAM-dependent methyltransferase [Celeribacter sp. PS-C1]MBW6419243.1 class I SAM-dependent methyltransferase [Celeribacter sp. PS-C1]
MTDLKKDARFWNRAARKYAASPVADMMGYERTLERTRQSLTAEDTVFEFGCGTGTTALKLAPSVRQYVASDISSEMIAIAREKADREGATNVRFEIGTPEETVWSEGTFDAVLGFSVLHLVPDLDVTLQSVHRLLKPGGTFITKTPCLREMNMLLRLVVPAMQLVGKAPSVLFLSAKELEQRMEAAGFEIVERARHGSGRKDARPFLVAKKRGA